MIAFVKVCKIASKMVAGIIVVAASIKCQPGVKRILENIQDDIVGPLARFARRDAGIFSISFFPTGRSPEIILLIADLLTPVSRARSD